MKLIIAEKPSLARNIMGAIEKYLCSSKLTKRDGFYENDEYVVTWAFGHLFGLIDIEEYQEDYDPKEKYYWNLESLPFCPSPFQFSLKKDPKTKKVDMSIKKQFSTISKLINNSDVDEIIHAGDSDREGEVIIRLILQNANKKNKPVKRLWIPDQTPETIKEGLLSIKSDDEYNDLANEGYARTYVDWLYGVNLTRYATLKAGTLLRVGRIIVPIVRAIYERDMEIQNFVPEKYYGVVSKEKTNGEIIELISKNTFKNTEYTKAKELCDRYNSIPAIVSDVKTERKTISSGKLYSLSKLQGVLGERYKMSLKDSLAIVQKLYESGFVTYPRTNTEYLATAEKDKIKNIINLLNKSGNNVKFKDNKSIFDDSKIESHSALTPTTKLPKIDSLTTSEQQVYNTILNRFLAVFCSEDCVVNRSTIIIDIKNCETFKLSGDILIQKGWMQYDISNKKDKVLPSLSIGDVVNTNFIAAEKETTPPKHYTTKSLGSFLENPFKKELNEQNELDAEDDEDDYRAILSGLELGTEATRTNIISNAINSKYISLKNNIYHIEKDGIFYVETLDKLLIDIDKYKTAQVGKLLKDIYHKKIKTEELIKMAYNEIDEMISHKDIEIERNNRNADAVGKCPKCGQNVIKMPWGYSCEKYKNGCNFAINGTVAGKKINTTTVRELLNSGQTSKISGFKSKAGNNFDAALKLVDGQYNGEERKQLIFVFDERKAPTPLHSVKCPRCGSNMMDDKWAWKCGNNCGVSVNHKIAGKELSIKDLESLVQDGETQKLDGFISKKGKPFSAVLMFDNDYKIVFNFEK